MEKLENLQLKDVSQIYEGLDHHCRCGCGGYYIATSFMVKPRSIVNDSEAQKLLDRAKKYARKSKIVEDGGTYLNIPMKRNKCFCIYLDEVE